MELLNEGEEGILSYFIGSNQSIYVYTYYTIHSCIIKVQSQLCVNRFQFPNYVEHSVSLKDK